MERTPNGDVLLDMPELMVAVVAVDLSPVQISNSSLAKRLRLAESATRYGITEEDQINENLLRESVKPENYISFMEEIDDREKFDSSVTIVPREEVELLENIILNLLEVRKARLVKYCLRAMQKPDKHYAELFANMHFETAELLFNKLFPE